MDRSMGSPLFQRSKGMTLDNQTFRECSQRMQLQLEPMGTMEEVSLCDTFDHRPIPPPRRIRNKKPCKLVTDLDADFLRGPSLVTSQHSPEELTAREASSVSIESSHSSQKTESTFKQIVLKMKSPKKLILSLMTTIADNVQLVQQDNLR